MIYETGWQPVLQMDETGWQPVLLSAHKTDR